MNFLNHLKVGAILIGLLPTALHAATTPDSTFVLDQSARIGGRHSIALYELLPSAQLNRQALNVTLGEAVKKFAVLGLGSSPNPSIVAIGRDSDELYFINPLSSIQKLGKRAVALHEFSSDHALVVTQKNEILMIDNAGKTTLVAPPGWIQPQFGEIKSIQKVDTSGNYVVLTDTHLLDVEISTSRLKVKSHLSLLGTNFQFSNPLAPNGMALLNIDHVIEMIATSEEIAIIARVTSLNLPGNNIKEPWVIHLKRMSPTLDLGTSIGRGHAIPSDSWRLLDIASGSVFLQRDTDYLRYDLAKNAIVVEGASAFDMKAPGQRDAILVDHPRTGFPWLPRKGLHSSGAFSSANQWITHDGLKELLNVDAVKRRISGLPAEETTLQFAERINGAETPYFLSDYFERVPAEKLAALGLEYRYGGLYVATNKRGQTVKTKEILDLLVEASQQRCVALLTDR